MATPPLDLHRLEADLAARGWTRAELARRVGVAGSSITRFLNGESQTNPLLARIAGALEQPVDRYLQERP